MATSPRRSLSLLACLLLSALVAVTLPSAADVRANDANKIGKELRETGQALDAANAKVARAMRAWNRANEKLPAARNALTAAKRAEGAAQRTADAAERRARAADVALQANQNRQTAMRARLTAIQGRMDGVARSLYQRGPFAEAEVVLSASDPGDFQLRLAAIDSIGRNQASVQNELARLQAGLVMEEVRQEALKEAADSEATKAAAAAQRATQARVAAAAAQAEIRTIISNRRAAAQRAKQHRGAVQARYQRLKAEQARVQAAAARAARREAARLAAQANRGTPASMVTPQGSLLWPMNGGRISGHVGPRIHPIFRYASCHTGTDIAAPSGTPVRAVGPGTVARISNGGPYGRAILLAHGEGLTTFYAHLSSTAVNVGQQVTSGQTIGAVGSTGWSTGPHLHFETRINGTAYDPMGWFGGSRRTVGC